MTSQIQAHSTATAQEGAERVLRTHPRRARGHHAPEHSAGPDLEHHYRAGEQPGQGQVTAVLSRRVARAWAYETKWRDLSTGLATVEVLICLRLVRCTRRSTAVISESKGTWM